MVDVKPGFFEKSTTGVVGRGKDDDKHEQEHKTDEVDAQEPPPETVGFFLS